VLDELDGRLEQLVTRATDAIFAQNTTYRDQPHRGMRPDVEAHVREHFQTALNRFREGREITREDLLFIRRHAARRAGRISVADFIQAFHLGQRTLCDEIIDIADGDAVPRAIVDLLSYITRYFDLATTHAAEVYVEAEAVLGAAGERLQRDVLEDLLRGTVPPPGPLLDSLRRAGLRPGAPYLVLAARPLSEVDDTHTLRSAGTALAGTGRLAVAPLTVIRDQEIVIVGPVRNPRLAGFLERLAASQARLERQGLALAVGVSTVHEDLAEVPDVYREAASARDRLAGVAGVVALPAMTAFDYLIGRGDDTARRLIAPRIAEFVADDIATGGVLIETLKAFAASDLSYKVTAHLLHVHLNTVRYRLAKITELTGRDPRQVRNLIELRIAAELISDSSV
jgi:hypothetical protein